MVLSLPSAVPDRSSVSRSVGREQTSPGMFALPRLFFPFSLSLANCATCAFYSPQQKERILHCSVRVRLAPFRVLEPPKEFKSEVGITNHGLSLLSASHTHSLTHSSLGLLRKTAKPGVEFSSSQPEHFKLKIYIHITMWRRRWFYLTFP